LCYFIYMSQANGYPEAYPSDLPYQEDYDYIRGVISDIHTVAGDGSYNILDAGILKRATETNEDFLPGGQFYDRIADLVTRRKRPDEFELFDLGVDIGARLAETKNNTRNIILGYLNTSLWMDTVKVGLVGQPASNKVVHAVLDYARKQVMDMLPVDAKTQNLFEVIARSLLELSESDMRDSNAIGWLFVKLDILDREYRSLREFKDVTTDYYSQKTQELSQDDIEKVDRDVQLLNEVSMANRKYGTKPAYTEASIGGSWIFFDGEDYRESLLRDSSNVLLPRFAAVVIHSPHTDLKNIRLDATEVRKANATARLVSTSIPSAEPDFAVTIALDGTMSVDAQGLQTLDRILKDSPLAASMLKAEIAANFYDLSMPIGTQTGADPRNYGGMSTIERKNFNPILQLLVPRIQSLQAPRVPSVESDRSVREHDVTWFVRKLRPGWSASPDALANAARIGISLGPNETFVKAHKRGIGHAVIGYHAVRRNIDMQPGVDY
jgi:hypothetical protein